MTRPPIQWRRIAALVFTLLFFIFGLCGTSLGLALFLARYSINPGAVDPGVTVRNQIGLVVFCFGCLLLYLALYVAWIRPRRRPVDPE